MADFCVAFQWKIHHKNIRRAVLDKSKDPSGTAPWFPQWPARFFWLLKMQASQPLTIASLPLVFRGTVTITSIKLLPTSYIWVPVYKVYYTLPCRCAVKIINCRRGYSILCITPSERIFLCLWSVFPISVNYQVADWLLKTDDWKEGSAGVNSLVKISGSKRCCGPSSGQRWPFYCCYL